MCSLSLLFYFYFNIVSLNMDLHRDVVPAVALLAVGICWAVSLNLEMRALKHCNPWHYACITIGTALLAALLCLTIVNIPVIKKYMQEHHQLDTSSMSISKEADCNVMLGVLDGILIGVSLAVLMFCTYARKSDWLFSGIVYPVACLVIFMATFVTRRAKLNWSNGLGSTIIVLGVFLVARNTFIND